MRNSFIVAVALALLGGCQEENNRDNNDTDHTAAFLGTWTNSTGQSTTTCGESAPQVGTIPAGEATFTFTKTSNTAVQMAFAIDAALCNLALAVNGSIGTFTANQACSLGDGTWTFKSGTFTVSGTTATMVSDTDQSANGMTCDADFTFALTKQ